MRSVHPAVLHPPVAVMERAKVVTMAVPLRTRVITEGVVLLPVTEEMIKSNNLSKIIV